MLHSDYRRLVPVTLPFQGRQMYMHTFDLARPVMAKGFEDYLGPVIALCRAAGALKGEAHMTVDEKVVQAGMSQRRPRPHVDGCFVPAKVAWDQGGGQQGWLHTCNNVPVEEYRRMAVIIAASAVGARAWRGTFEGEPKGDGDLTHLGLRPEDGEILPAGMGYVLSPDCVHESMRLKVDTQRSFLRIALPTSYEWGMMG